MTRHTVQPLRSLNPPCNNGQESQNPEARKDGLNLGLNQQMTRRLNKVALLRLLHIHGPMSRVELAASLGLDTKTLTNLSRELLGRGFVESAGVVAGGDRKGRIVLGLG